MAATRFTEPPPRKAPHHEAKGTAPPGLPVWQRCPFTWWTTLRYCPGGQPMPANPTIGPFAHRRAAPSSPKATQSQRRCCPCRCQAACLNCTRKRPACQDQKPMGIQVASGAKKQGSRCLPSADGRYPLPLIPAWRSTSPLPPPVMDAACFSVPCGLERACTSLLHPCMITQTVPSGCIFPEFTPSTGC